MNRVYCPIAHRPSSDFEILKHRYDLFDSSLIPSIFHTSLGLTAVRWQKPTSWSTSHVIYIVTVKEKKQPLILRANIQMKYREIGLLIDKMVTDRVAAVKVPVNKILIVDISRKHVPFDYQIQETLIGKDIEDHFVGSRETYDRLSFELGVYAAKIHSLTFEKFGLFDPREALRGHLVGGAATFFDYIKTKLGEDIRFITNANVISIRVADTIVSLFEEYEPVMRIARGHLIHHDLADHNIMYARGRITGIFDWEATGVGDPVLDLASAPTWKTHYPREEKMIEGYRSISSLPEHFTEKMHIYRLRTMLWKIRFAIVSGFLNKERRHRFQEALDPFHLKASI